MQLRTGTLLSDGKPSDNRAMAANTEMRNHTRSYYAATTNEVTDYPQLRGAESADVCVVGAGFTCVATALTLAERGYSVALVEANRVGWGASGRNGGQVINGMSGLGKIAKKHGDSVAALIRNLKWRGNDIIRERIQKYGIDCDLKDGFVEVATKPRQLAFIEEYAAEREADASGHHHEVWDRQTTGEMLGTTAFYGGFACYRDGHLHRRAARTLGLSSTEHAATARPPDRPLRRRRSGPSSPPLPA